MAQIIVPHKYHAQQTGWTCGPSTAKVTLSTFDKDVDEATLARECGTTVNGTDDINQIVAVVNRRAAAAYAKHQWVGWNSTPDQVEALWRFLVSTITVDRRAVMVNIWAGPGTGVPGYPQNQTIMHYITVVGVDTDKRMVYVSDSARFQGIEHWWMSVEKFAVLIPPKAYAALPLRATTPAPQPAPARLTAERLAEAMGNSVSAERYRQLFPAFADAMRAAGITNEARAAMWCAQLGHESAGLRYMEEIASGAAYEGRADLGNTQPGDGVRFKGRGPIQVTGRHNYTECSKWAHSKGLVPTPRFFVDNPAQLASDRYGFIGAVWYWTVARPQINQLSDARDLEGVTRAINGGLNGIDDRRARYNRCRALGAALLPPDGGFLMALTDAEQAELLRKTREIHDQLGPKHPAWGEWSSFGKDEQGNELSQRDGLIDKLNRILSKLGA